MVDLDSIARELRFSRDFLEIFKERFGERFIDVARLMKTPVRRYFLRVNTLRIDRESLLEVLEDEIGGEYSLGLGDLPESIYIETKGPFEIEEVEKKVVADKFAAESVYMGAHLYCPGVLDARGVERGDLVNVVDEFGQVVALGIALRSGREMMVEKRGIAVEIRESVFRLPSIRELESYKRGLFYAQSYPAMLASRALDPKPGEIVVDMCAAPGGKTTHLAELSGGRALIVAVDKSESKLRAMERELERLGTPSVLVLKADSRYLHKILHSKADAVLLDPPCTALGVRPKLFDFTSWRDVENCYRYQVQFLEPAFRILKPGGRLVYSTCTITKRENEGVVERILEDFKMELLDDVPHMDRNPRFFSPEEDFPGFFIAVFRKKGE